MVSVVVIQLSVQSTNEKNLFVCLGAGAVSAQTDQQSILSLGTEQVGILYTDDYVINANEYVRGW